jgi:undecaprenyl-diphosphatase
VSVRLLLVAVLVLAPVQSLDDAVRSDVQSARTGWLESPMRGASAYARPALFATAVFAAVSGAAGRAFALELAVALLPVNVIVECTKYTTNRARPGGAHRRSNAAFPSSHAANAFAVAMVLARRWRRLAVPAFALAAIVGYSRMYLDRHWLSDVVAGAVLGAGVAWWTVGEWRRRRGARTPAGPATGAA